MIVKEKFFFLKISLGFQAPVVGSEGTRFPWVITHDNVLIFYLENPGVKRTLWFGREVMPHRKAEEDFYR